MKASLTLAASMFCAGLLVGGLVAAVVVVDLVKPQVREFPRPALVLEEDPPRAPGEPGPAKAVAVAE